MITIGLTGGSGTGKSLVADRFALQGARVADADRIYYRLVQENEEMRDELREAFGEQVFLPDGALNRAYLGQKVFSDKQARQTLNGITHFYITDAVIRQLEAWRNALVKVAVYDAPLLFETAADKFCQATIGVVAPVATRVERICQRDGIDKQQALNRVESQPPELFYWQRCQHVIVNDGTLDQLYRKADTIYRQLTEKGV